MTLSVPAYAASLRRDGDALAAVAASNLEASVPGCPGWSVRDLVVHTGGVHRFWSQIVERRLQNPRDVDRTLTEPGDGPLVDWFRDGVMHLAEVIEHADGGEPIWSWSGQKNIAFVQRRMPQETAVHRWDAEAAAGVAGSIEPELARDGVDEYFDIFMPAEESSFDGRGETIHLHQTDGGGEWVLELGPERVQVERGHRKGDAAVRGSGSDLLLMLWRRIPLSAVEVIGDRALVERFIAWMDLE
jgi:uncharacterized protein (TIGR03083 family)